MCSLNQIAGTRVGRKPWRRRSLLNGARGIGSIRKLERVPIDCAVVGEPEDRSCCNQEDELQNSRPREAFTLAINSTGKPMQCDYDRSQSRPKEPAVIAR